MAGDWTDWPFFDDAHRRLARDVDAWAGRELQGVSHADLDAACRDLVGRLGAAGWLRYVVAGADGGARETLDLRSLCIIRETLARHEPLADFCFAVQALGAGPIALFGTADQRAAFLPAIRDGRCVAAFAISEADAGSDVAAMSTTARPDGDGFILEGEKTWISNAGIADRYVVFCRTPEEGAKGFGAFVLDAPAAGLTVTARIATLAPHPLGTLRLDRCRVPGSARLGPGGKGLRVALGTLDVFRAAVAAAALGMGRRALKEALEFARERRAFGQALVEHQLTRARLADMATAMDASALLVARAAWTRDAGAGRVTRESAMAKLHATEAAQQVIDGAVQLLGARGVVEGSVTERLYREIRALRIYEGTSEVQRLVIADQITAS